MYNEEVHVRCMYDEEGMMHNLHLFVALFCTHSMYLACFVVYSERLADDLWLAVYDDDVNRVRTLLQQGANPSHPLYRREEWWNRKHGELLWKLLPLHTACSSGNLKLLVKAGANIDKGNGKKKT